MIWICHCDVTIAMCVPVCNIKHTGTWDEFIVICTTWWLKIEKIISKLISGLNSRTIIWKAWYYCTDTDAIYGSHQPPLKVCKEINSSRMEWESDPDPEPKAEKVIWPYKAILIWYKYSISLYNNIELPSLSHWPMREWKTRISYLDISQQACDKSH